MVYCNITGCRTIQTQTNAFFYTTDELTQCLTKYYRFSPENNSDTLTLAKCLLSVDVVRVPATGVRPPRATLVVVVPNLVPRAAFLDALTVRTPDVLLAAGAVLVQTVGSALAADHGTGAGGTQAC